jgi:hypothetical protein
MVGNDMAEFWRLNIFREHKGSKYLRLNFSDEGDVGDVVG